MHPYLLPLDLNVHTNHNERFGLETLRGSGKAPCFASRFCTLRMCWSLFVLFHFVKFHFTKESGFFVRLKLHWSVVYQCSALHTEAPRTLGRVLGSTSGLPQLYFLHQKATYIFLGQLKISGRGNAPVRANEKHATSLLSSSSSSLWKTMSCSGKEWKNLLCPPLGTSDGTNRVHATSYLDRSSYDMLLGVFLLPSRGVYSDFAPSEQEVFQVSG